LHGGNRQDDVQLNMTVTHLMLLTRIDPYTISLGRRSINAST